LTGCDFDTNDADRGGGMYNEDSSSPVVTNCTFSGNTASQGGGMYNEDSSSPVVTNCTFSGNTAAGGGMGNLGSSPTLTNCIFWGDTPDEIANMGSTPAVNYCDVQGGYGTGTGNINANPMFAGVGDYHLQLGSPCIDVGNNSAPAIPATDFDGDPRIIDGDGDLVDVVDMGIDEFSITLSGGSDQDSYQPDENVSFSISGFPAGALVEVTIVAENNWQDGDDIPQDPGETIFAQATFTTDGSGMIDNQVIWSAPLEPGEYDMVFDIDGDGTYNFGADMVDDPHDPGFIVAAASSASGSVGGDVYPVDKAALLIPWLGLGLLLVLAAGGLMLVRRRSHR